MWRCFDGGDPAPLHEVWAAAAAAAHTSIFQSFAFTRWWLQAYAGEVQPRIWVHSPEPMVVPLALRQNRLSLAGEGMFDYSDVIGAGSERLEREAVEWIEHENWNEARFTGVPEASSHRRFFQALEAEPEPFSMAPLRTAQGPDAARQLEREHPRAARRWQRAQASGLELRLEQEPRERARLLAWLMASKAQRLAVQEQANVLGEREVRWLELMMANEPALCELWSLRRGSQVLSGLLCWRSATVRYAYTIAYDATAAQLSPGILLLFAVLRRTMEERRSFDFLTGEQGFKQRFATDRRSLLRYRCLRACLA